MRKFLCCGFLFLIILSLCSCGRLRTRWEISTMDYNTRNSFKVGMWVKNSNVNPTWNCFTIDEDLDGFKQLLEKKIENLHIEKYGEEYLYLYYGQPFLIKEVEKGEEDSENGHRYALFAPAVIFETECGHRVGFHLPYHLLDGIDVFDDTFDIQVADTTNAGLNEIEDFYRAFECYETQVEGNVLYVSNPDVEWKLKITVNEAGNILFQTCPVSEIDEGI